MIRSSRAAGLVLGFSLLASLARAGEVVAGPEVREPAKVAGPPPAEVAVEPQPAERPGPSRVSMDYAWTTQSVWPPYANSHPGFVSVLQGVSFAAARPSGAAGSRGAIAGSLRGGYALGDSDVELLGEIGANLVGPRTLSLDVGARWMLTPSLHGTGASRFAGSFFAGPELTAGALVRFGSSSTAPGGADVSTPTTARPVVGVGLDMAIQATPTFGLEGQLVSLRWVPSSDGSLLLLGASLGACLRF